MSSLTLGSVLTAARGSRSLRDMAKLSGVDHSLLARIEKGEISLPRRETMAAVAQGYGLNIEFLARVAYCGGNDPADADNTASTEETPPADSTERKAWPPPRRLGNNSRRASAVAS